MKYDIFISYRRDGGEVTARILRDSLTERGYNVFFDVESLRSGAFNTKLYSVIDECRDFIIVLSPNALDRCANPEDWVRREVEYALEKKKNVIPILLRSFEFPDDLPESMGELPNQNGLTANLELFDAFLDKLESFLWAKKRFWARIKDLLKTLKTMQAVLAAAALLVAGLLTFNWFQQYPRTQEQIDLTESVIGNVGYTLSCMDVLAEAHRDMLQAAEDCLITGEESVCASRFALCANTFEETDIASAQPDQHLLSRMESSQFSSEEMKAMYNALLTFREESVDTLAYMEFVVSDECVLSDSEKLRIISLYEEYLTEQLEWFACCANEMLLPVTAEKYLEDFWQEVLPYLGSIPLSEKNWSREREALVEAGNECYENMQDILTELSGIQGDSNAALRQMQEDTIARLVEKGYTRERAEKIVDYMSRDWEAELTESYLRQGCSQEEAQARGKEEAELRSWELDVMLKLSPLITDEVGLIWDKMTYLLDLGMYEEAEECINLYQMKMTNSDRYLPGLVLFSELMQEDILDYGIMVMEYYEADGINEVLMIGDIIYGFNGEPCRTVADYLAMKAALTTDSYTVKLFRLDEDLSIQILELILTTDMPRVYINDLTPVAE